MNIKSEEDIISDPTPDERQSTFLELNKFPTLQNEISHDLGMGV